MGKTTTTQPQKKNKNQKPKIKKEDDIVKGKLPRAAFGRAASGQTVWRFTATPVREALKLLTATDTCRKDSQSR